MRTISYFLCCLYLILLAACTDKATKNHSSEATLVSNKVVEPIAIPQTFHYYQDFPSQYTEARDVEIWLPTQYDTATSLAVLYLFDGQNLFHGMRGWSGEYEPGWDVDHTLDSLIHAKVIPPVMVVAIANSSYKRGSEYMPQKPADLLRQRIAETEVPYYARFREYPPESDAHLRFVVEELKPFVDRQFKTKSDQAHTFIGGSSMGGLLSAYAISEYPDVFGGAACFSTHWTALNGVFIEHLKDHLPDPNTHKIYFDYGTEGLDAGYEPFQKIVDQAMQDRGYEADENWLTRKFDGEDHHEKYWRERFHLPITFLLN